MAEHQWAPPEHPDVTLHQPVQFPTAQANVLEHLDPEQPVWAEIRYEAFPNALRLKCFAIARSDSAVLLYTAWQGRRQEVLVSRAATLSAAARSPHVTADGATPPGPVDARPGAQPARGGLRRPGLRPPAAGPRAWLQFPDRTLEVEARVIAWTERAVLVEWGFGQAAETAWLWWDAVRSVHFSRTSHSGR